MPAGRAWCASAWAARLASDGRGSSGGPSGDRRAAAAAAAAGGCGVAAADCGCDARVPVDAPLCGACSAMCECEADALYCALLLCALLVPAE